MLCAAAPAERVEERAFRYRTVVEAVAFSEKAETIANPLQWPMLMSVAPDGLFVEQGTPIAEFDQAGLLLRLENLQRDQAIVQAELEQTLVGLRNKEMGLNDDMEGLRDRLEVLRTQLARTRALPEPDDVEIARGRLRVAQLEYDAAAEELRKARHRIERKMISPGELDAFELADREARARLDYQRGMLDLVSLRALPADVRRIELSILNVEAEIEKQLNESARNKEISEIERKGAEARAATMEQQMVEMRADLSNAVVRAPISGHIVYQPLFRKFRGQTGHKMWKDFAFIKMPVPGHLALKGELRESERRFFKAGDEVIIRAALRPGEILRGCIASLSAMSRDRAEEEGEVWRKKSNSGIVVYDVVIAIENPPAWLRVGMGASCELIASAEVTAPAVPATLVKTRAGAFYLALDGVYRKVDGTLVDGYLMLTDPALAGREVSLYGQFPEVLDRRADENLPGFRVAGELQPAATEDVVVGDVLRWQKVAWVIAEDTMVTQGQALVRLDALDTDEAIKKAEAELEQAVNSREKEEQESRLRARENEFNVARTSNTLEIARLELQELLHPRGTEALLTARFNHALANIRLEFLERELQRVSSARAAAFSPLEIEKLKRDRQRAELRQEAARIRLREIEDGPEPYRICLAEQAVVEQEIEWSNLRAKLDADGFRKSYMFRRAEREERRLQAALAERRLERENLLLSAPHEGLVRYGKVRDSGVWAKIAVGSMVSDRAVVAQIADVSRMYVRVEVPEVLYTGISPGMRVAVKPRALTAAVLQGTVTEIEFLFQPREQKDTARGLYSAHETLGETVFLVRVEVERRKGLELKPGTMAEVIFPQAPGGAAPGRPPAAPAAAGASS